mmetsp:Transcript_37082/g.90906  ORF Transcript_37082/g.90906 Transcript_37082/m.90906 type:complete len:111 (-) Transcript_37082:603-935(-)
MVTKYGNGRNSLAVYTALLTDTRKDRSIAPSSLNKEKRLLAQTRPGSVSKRYAARLHEQEVLHGLESLRNSFAGRFWLRKTDTPDEKCICPSSFTRTLIRVPQHARVRHK